MAFWKHNGDVGCLSSGPGICLRRPLRSRHWSPPPSFNHPRAAFRADLRLPRGNYKGGKKKKMQLSRGLIVNLWINMTRGVWGMAAYGPAARLPLENKCIKRVKPIYLEGGLGKGERGENFLQKMFLWAGCIAASYFRALFFFPPSFKKRAV